MAWEALRMVARSRTSPSVPVVEIVVLSLLDLFWVEIPNNWTVGSLWMAEKVMTMRPK
jgi:hypothetical protein